MVIKREKPVLRIEELRLTLGTGGMGERPREVLRGLSLEIPRGRSVAVLGMTGSGKSLLCRAVTRLFHRVPVREVSGAVWFGEENLLEVGEARRLQWRGARIGHVLQDAHQHFHPRMTIAQHFELVLRHKMREKPDWVGHSMGYLYRVGIVDPDELLTGRVFPGELDVLTRQKVMFGLVLACEPELLVADEPTAEFDRNSVAKVAGALEGLKGERGLSVLFATGRVRRAEQFGDEVAILDRGEIVECAPPLDLFREAREEMTKAFVDGTLPAGRKRERLLDVREPPRVR